jgi:hypothetical protein
MYESLLAFLISSAIVRQTKKKVNPPPIAFGNGFGQRLFAALTCRNARLVLNCRPKYVKPSLWALFET